MVCHPAGPGTSTSLMGAMGSTRICTLVLLIALLAACSPTPPDRRPQAEALAGELRVLPAVQSVRADVVDSPAQDLVAVRIGVEANGDITADQIAAVVERYLDGLSDVDYTGYRTELRVTSASSLFAVESNDPRITNGPEVVAQSRSWAGARREFPDASIHLTAAVVHPPVQFGLDGGPPAHRPPPDVGHGAFGDMELPDPADYRTLSDTVTRMAARFPDLAAGGWTFLTG